MPMKVENAFTLPMACNQTDRAIVRALFCPVSLQPLAFEAILAQSFFKKIGAHTIISSRWVLRGYRDQLGQQRSHFLLPLPEPFHREAAFCLSFAHSFVHAQHARNPSVCRQAPLWCRRPGEDFLCDSSP